MRLDFWGQQEPHARASGFWDRRATSGGSFYISAFFKKNSVGFSERRRELVSARLGFAGQLLILGGSC